MGENSADDKPSSSACLLQGGQDPPNEADSVEPMDKNRMMKRKICPSPLHQLDSVRSAFSFGLQPPPRSMADPAPTPRFGPEITSGDPRVSNDQGEDWESKRRKHCPSYIVPSFSFSLDHNSDGSPESTPKFGSFPFPAAATEVEIQGDGQALLAPSSREKEDEEEGEEEEGSVEVER